MRETGNPQFRVTVSADPGHRKHMEDRYAVTFKQVLTSRGLVDLAYFAVFDGHGGSEAANFAKNTLFSKIVEAEDFWSEDDSLVKCALMRGFYSCHLEMWNEIGNWPCTIDGHPSTAGSTASVVILRENKVFIANVGDSSVVLGTIGPNGQWIPRQLTQDHKPDDSRELYRIKACGGSVKRKRNVCRVVWEKSVIFNRKNKDASGNIVERRTDAIPFLAVARSLGDLWSYNSSIDDYIVSPYPDVQVLYLNPDFHRCLILATDGLWNVINFYDAVETVRFCENERNKLIQLCNSEKGFSHGNMKNVMTNCKWPNPAKVLVRMALGRCENSRNRADNITAVTICFEAPSDPCIVKSYVAENSYHCAHDLSDSKITLEPQLPVIPSQSVRRVLSISQPNSIETPKKSERLRTFSSVEYPTSSGSLKRCHSEPSNNYSSF